MARKPNEKKMNEIYETIQQHPGKRSGWIAAVLHIPRSDVTRTLPCLEERGLYVSEDEEGQLFPFRDKQK